MLKRSQHVDVRGFPGLHRREGLPWSALVEAITSADVHALSALWSEMLFPPPPTWWYLHIF